MSGVVKNIRAPVLIVSFNNEGYLTREDVETILRQRGSVGVIENDYKRYVGAQIGIWNPKGVKVGKVSHLRNKENLYVVAPLEWAHRIDTAIEATGSQLTLFD